MRCVRVRRQVFLSFGEELPVTEVMPSTDHLNFLRVRCEVEQFYAFQMQVLDEGDATAWAATFALISNTARETRSRAVFVTISRWASCLVVVVFNYS